jgi:hypothetical protein
MAKEIKTLVISNLDVGDVTFDRRLIRSSKVKMQS